jgi:catechol 2,3-dioxygenase-like lactoylglutathione lyase family enzyme
MIIGFHTLIYSEDPVATRAFFLDVLGFPCVDAGGGWLIFALPPGELGVHPTHEEGAPPVKPGRHKGMLMCSDIHATVNDLKAKGVEFTTGISDEGWGLLTALRLPGAGTLDLYEPRHPTMLPNA